MKHGLVTLGTLLCAAFVVAAQADRHAVLDRILDTYVRDGLVYYNALRIERGPLDRYVNSLNVDGADLERWPPAAQRAFWINAYNALVLRTVVNAYPIATRSSELPPHSVRQIPGAFDTVRHAVGGRLVTLDEIEALLLASSGDARIVLALGRGAMGSGRLRSEAFSADRLEAQLDEAVRECAIRATCVSVDRTLDRVEITPLIGWHEEAFVRTFSLPGDLWRGRSPIERAVVTMVYPHLYASEQLVLERDTFALAYGTFDWRLNDR